jgi:hypothetical protein
MVGMDRAIYISAFAIMAMAVVSFFLIKDSVAQGAPVSEQQPEFELALDQAADGYRTPSIRQQNGGASPVGDAPRSRYRATRGITCSANSRIVSSSAASRVSTMM